MTEKTKTYVPLEWHRISWMPGETWEADIFPRIVKSGVNIDHLDRCVYVIRLAGNICINYPKGTSPVVYIGEGRLKGRLRQHKAWTDDLTELVGDYEFEVSISTPRVRNNEAAYRSVEAALIDYFGVTYGTTPLWNKQFETQMTRYAYNKRSFKEALGMRSGTRYLWSIRPMRSSHFFQVFDQNASGRRAPYFRSPP